MICDLFANIHTKKDNKRPSNCVLKAKTLIERIGKLQKTAKQRKWNCNSLQKEFQPGIDEALEIAIKVFSGETDLDSIGLLTHNKEYEPYEEYIDRIIKSGNHLAIAVKMNDLRHNIARGKAGNHERLVQKHEAALDKFNKPMFQ